MNILIVVNRRKVTNEYYILFLDPHKIVLREEKSFIEAWFYITMLIMNNKSSQISLTSIPKEVFVVDLLMKLSWG